MRILFLTSGPSVPSTRFRILQYVPRLRAEGHHCVIAHSRPPKYEQSPWLGFRLSRRARRTFRRIELLRARVHRFDVIVLERELFDDPSFDLELKFAGLARRFVLDIDDGVFLRYPDKFAGVAAVSTVIAGSTFLAEEARRFTTDVVVVPTCVDLSRFQQKTHRPTSMPVVGWTGTSSNLGYFSEIAPALAEVARSHPFELQILADEVARRALPVIPGATTRFVPWSMDNETQALLQFDVGIMPLPDDAWSRFKCGFKLIQYMAAGLPTVASPVGVNPQITAEGMTGVLPRSTEEWTAALKQLLADAELRARFGAAGRQVVEQRYSLGANWPVWRQAVLGEGT